MLFDILSLDYFRAEKCPPEAILSVIWVRNASLSKEIPISEDEPQLGERIEENGEEDPIDELFNNDEEALDEEEGENLFGDDMERLVVQYYFLIPPLIEITVLSPNWTTILNLVWTMPPNFPSCQWLAVGQLSGLWLNVIGWMMRMPSSMTLLMIWL